METHGFVGERARSIATSLPECLRSHPVCAPPSVSALFQFHF